LYLDSDPTGNIVEGTGDAISFGLQTEEGFYAVVASNDNCDIAMTGQVEIYYEFPPLEPATPEGPEVICNDTSSTYESDGVEDADSYVWVLEPVEAGTLTFDELEATVEWNQEFSGMAEISLYGINECGDGNPSLSLEVQVNDVPDPEINGEDMVCDYQVEVYEVTETPGNTYVWEVTGGAILNGDSTYSVTIEWGEVGNGTLIVTESSGAGCEKSSEIFEVLIDDCTFTAEIEKEEDVLVYPNPAGGLVNIKSENHISRLEIYSLDGELVFFREGIPSAISIDTREFKNGLYLVRIITEKTVISRRLVVQ
jgi:hypothetical protein